MIKNKSTNLRNEEISANVIILISKEGENLGEKETINAISLAQNLGLDLVQVDEGEIPICKLMDFNKVKYHKQKKDNKKKPLKRKEIRFSINIADHDMQIKINHAQKFIKSGHEVKIVLQKQRRHNLSDSETENILIGIANRIGAIMKKDSKINKNNRFWSLDLSP